MTTNASAIELVLKVEGKDKASLQKALRCALEDLDVYRPSLEALRVEPGTPFCGGMGTAYIYELQVKEVQPSPEFISGIESSALAKKQEFR